MNTKEEVIQILYDLDIPYTIAKDAVHDIQAVYVRANTKIKLDNAKQLKGAIRRFRIKVLQLKAGAYCVECKRYYTFREWDALPSERIYPQYMASYHVCECGSKLWEYIG